MNLTSSFISCFLPTQQEKSNRLYTFGEPLLRNNGMLHLESKFRTDFYNGLHLVDQC